MEAMWQRSLFLASLFIACWLWFQIVHELGHVLGALATGGQVTQVVLHPLAISRTDVQGSRQPLVVVWAGPVMGCALPLVVWWIAAMLKWPAAFVLRFFAGTCLVANGTYLFAGSFDGVGDCGDLLRHGAPIWTLWLFGLVTMPAGLLLWNDQGGNFGFGRQAKPISTKLVYSTAAVAAATIVAELSYSSLWL
jgi:hypothetical protein